MQHLAYLRSVYNNAQGLSASEVRATISAAVENHSIGCRMQSRFLAPQGQLLVQCSVCSQKITYS